MSGFHYFLRGLPVMKAKQMAKPMNTAKKGSGHDQEELNQRRELIVKQLSSHVSRLRNKAG